MESPRHSFATPGPRSWIPLAMRTNTPWGPERRASRAATCRSARPSRSRSSRSGPATPVDFSSLLERFAGRANRLRPRTCRPLSRTSEGTVVISGGKRPSFAPVSGQRVNVHGIDLAIRRRALVVPGVARSRRPEPQSQQGQQDESTLRPGVHGRFIGSVLFVCCSFDESLGLGHTRRLPLPGLAR